jgi:hypothetical protein
MKKNNVKEAAAVLLMAVLVCAEYTRLYNDAFTGHDARGAHIWLSASTVKFVNNWLKEGPLNLNFIMYECPDSIEFNNITERSAYISYPPGAVIPPYLLAKLLHKDEIQIGFIKQFLKVKFLFDSLLVCFIAYSILRFTLRLKQRILAALASVMLSTSWMCIPINLYYLRNVYFSDQCIISVVLFYILLEIYDEYFSRTSQTALKYIYFGLKFTVSLYGVLTDWYFFFVLFTSWLVKIIPLFKVKNAIKNSVFPSFVYVLPVLSGISLYILQITMVPDYKAVILNKMKDRTFFGDTGTEEYNKIVILAENFVKNYSFGWILIAVLVILSILVLASNRKNKSFLTNHKRLFSIIPMIYAPPFLQVLVFQQHSAIHEFSLLKFALPVTLSVIMLSSLALELKKMFSARFSPQTENNNDLQKMSGSAFYAYIIAASVLLSGMVNGDKYGYLKYHIGIPVSYERENLIRANYHFNDVYFSFTETIDANPPEFLAVSKKLIYKIENISDISRKFPNLKPDARILLMVNKNDPGKPAQIQEKEQSVLHEGDTQLIFSSENYDVWVLSGKYEEG